MSVQVDITSESRFPINRKKIREKIGDVVERHKMRGNVCVEVLVVGDRKMRTLNRTYRKVDQTTDVLSFPLEDPEQPVAFAKPPDGMLWLGSVVVSYPQAVAEAGEEGMLVDDKISFLIEHGIQHLLGIHHNND